MKTLGLLLACAVLAAMIMRVFNLNGVNNTGKADTPKGEHFVQCPYCRRMHQ